MTIAAMSLAVASRLKPLDPELPEKEREVVGKLLVALLLGRAEAVSRVVKIERRARTCSPHALDIVVWNARIARESSTVSTR